MKRVYHIFGTLLFTLGLCSWGLAQNDLCADMEPICTNAGVSFTANASGNSAEAGNNYGCLTTNPDPAWYYFEIATSGNIDMSLSAPQDIDYAVWGPYADFSAAQSACGALPTPIDCSYDPTANETPSISGAIVGEVYIMVITNYAGSAQNISLTQTGGTGSTDCSILLPCATVGFSDITANSPYDCTGSAVTLTAFPQSNSPSDLSITPGFQFTIETDAFSSIDNTLTLYNGTTTIAYWGPTNTGGNYQGTVPNSSTFEGIIEYLDSLGTYSLDWCDTGMNGSFVTTIGHSGSNNIISTSPLDGTQGCTTINLGSPDGFPVFSGTGVTNNNDGTGSFDPSVAGGGVHQINYDWSSSSCSGTATQTVVVCCDPGTPFITTFSGTDTVCNGSIDTLDAPIAGSSNSAMTFSNTGSTGITSFGTATSTITTSSVVPILLAAGVIDSVCLDLTVSGATNLTIDLISPDGNSINLSSGNGGFGTYQNTCFSVNATDAITNYAGFASIPVDSSFIPEESFNNLAGDQTNGDWQLSISSTGTAGTLNSWSIVFAPTTASNTYQWSGPNMSCTTCANPEISPTSNSTYSVTVTDAYGCQFTDSYNIIVSDPLTSAVVSCGTATANSVTFDWTAVSGASGYLVSIDSGQTFVSPNNGALSHTVTGLGINQDVQMIIEVLGGSSVCNTPIDTFVCTSLNCALVGNIDVLTDASCFTGTDGGFTLSATGALGSLSYQMTSPTTGVSQSSGTFNNLAAGIYTIEITDATQGCSIPQNVTVGEPSVINLAISPNATSCNGGSDGSISTTTSGGTSPYTYLWSDGQTTATANNLSAGTYSLTVSDNNSCSIIATETVTEPSLLVVSVDSTDVNCFGGSDGTAIATASGGTSPYTYLWSDGQTTTTASGLAIGTISLIVTDANSCIQTANTTIEQPATALSSTITTTDALCSGSSDGTAIATANGGTSPYTYLWSDNQTTATATSLAAGSHSVTITDNNACTTINTAIVNNANIISLSTSQTDVSCNAGADATATVTASGGAGSFTYLWSDNQTTATATGLSAIQYTITVTDLNGCEENTSLTIIEPQALGNSVFTINNITCNGDGDGTASVSLSGGIPPYTYAWSNGNNSQQATGLGGGDHYVTVTDANFCTFVDTATVIEPDILSLSASTDSVNCRGDATGAARIVVSGGTTPYASYLWSNGATTTDNENIIAGVYTVTVTDANSCTVSGSVTVGQPLTVVSTSILTSTNVLCNGGADGTATADALGGTPPYTFVWSSGETTASATGLSAGTQTITVTDALGCIASASVTLTEPTAIVSSAFVYSNYNGSDISCIDQSDGSARVQVAGGVSPYIYQWSDVNNQTTAIATGLPEGAYTVTITDASGCVVEDTVSLLDPEVLVVEENSVDVFCHGDATGQILITSVTGGTVGLVDYEYSISGPGLVAPFSDTSSYFGLIAGTYTVTVRDGNDCVLPLSIEITEPDTLDGSISSVAASCNGSTDGSLIPSVFGGTAPYSFAWSTGSSDSILTAVVAGGYSVTVTDANTCIAVLNGILSQPAALAANITSTSTSCYGGTNGRASVSASGGDGNYSYLWSNGSSLSTASNLSAGSHHLTITDGQSCSLVETFTIDEPSVLTAITSVYNVTCGGSNNGSAEVLASGGTGPYTYLWSDGQTDSIASSLVLGAYSVVVTDANGCLFQSSISLTEPDALVISLLSTTGASCNGQADGSAEIEASGGTGGFSYLWSNGQTTATATGLDAGTTHQVTVTDANNCTAEMDVQITEPSLLEMGSIQTTLVSCKFGSDGTASASALGGTAPYSFSWSNGSLNQTASDLSAGTYTVSVEDANACMVVSSFIISEPSQQLSASTNSSSALCMGSSTGEMAVFVGGGSSPYTYTWSNGASTAVVDSVEAGTYTVSVEDASGCSLDQVVTVGDGGTIQLSILSQTNITCFEGADGNIVASASGDNLPLSYTWSDPAGQTSLAASGLTAGTYFITVTDANACTHIDSTTLSQPDAITANALIENVSCYGGSDGSIEVFGSNASISLYDWSTGLQNTTGVLSNLSIGSYGLTLTDNNACQASFTYLVEQPDSLIADLSINEAISCYGETDASIIASIDGGSASFEYIWSNGSDTTSTAIRSNLGAGRYEVEVIDANACSANASIDLEDPLAVQLQISVLGESCPEEANGQIVVSATGGNVLDGTYDFSIDSLNWQTGNIFGSVASGIYMVYAMDDRGCLGDTSIVLDAADPFFISSFVADTTIEFGDTLSIFVELNDTTEVSYSWTRIQGNDQGGPEISTDWNFLAQPVIQTAYVFEASNGGGCSIDSTVNITVNRPMRVGVPQAFSPNGDGINDFLFVQTDEKVSKILSFRIYSRWGELVYANSNTNPNEETSGWDGTFKQRSMNSGVFAWYTEVEFIDGSVEVFKGDVNLLR